MVTQLELSAHALQRFTPDPDAVYHIDAVAHLTRLPRHLIVVCCKHGLVEPALDPDYGFYFNESGIRTLQHIEYLHLQCGINFTGLRIILGLMDEVERLRAEVDSRY